MFHRGTHANAAVGLVLAGGGMRGAYEVGVLKGLAEVLTKNRRPVDYEGPFQFVGGTSVGAINCAFVAANAHEPDLGVEKLVEAWEELSLSTHLQLQLGAWLEQLLRGVQTPEPTELYLGSSLLDPQPLESLVSHRVDWPQLHKNIASGRLRGLLIAALQVSTGRTAIFSELAPNSGYVSTLDPRRVSLLEPITASHILASAAIPLLFPARRVGDEFYCDGGLRFNTPIAPVIRAGAEKVVIITTLRSRALAEKVKLEYYPTAGFLLGKVLNALLLDPLEYDLQVLQRINRLLELHARALNEAAQEEARELFTQTRGMPYRPIETLVFSPSQDIGALAGSYVREHGGRLAQGAFMRWIFRSASRPGSVTDWISYLLFDGGFARLLIELGRADVIRRSEEVRRFFYGEAR